MPFSTRKAVSDGISDLDGNQVSEDLPERLLQFVSAVHDIGKASPAFQGRGIFQNPSSQLEIRRRLESAKLPMRYDLDNPNATPHSIISEIILEKKGIDPTIAVVPGGHHGKSPDEDDLEKVGAFRNHTGLFNQTWSSVHNELLDYALSLSGLDIETVTNIKISACTQVLLTGTTIMSDWIASSESNFPYHEEFVYNSHDLERRADFAWNKLDLPSVWEPNEDWMTGELYKLRFGFNPRPFQKSVVDVAGSMSHPGIMIVEAPMGEGKTEAALAAAEVLAERYGKNGLFFALPTQATADGIFERTRKWMVSAIGTHGAEKHTLFLAHGKSRFNKSYMSIPREKWNIGNHSEGDKPHTGNVVVHEWFSGRKKGLLSDVAVGTVDQILMAGLKQKHLALRHLGLSNKVVIIDECHAYDTYMGSYLVKALSWLGSYDVPVILLSATLPPDRRYEFINEYLGVRKGNRNADLPKWATSKRYPLITYSNKDGVQQEMPKGSGRSLEVKINKITDEEIVEILENATSGGGFAGIILNTVGRAQSLAQELSKRFGKEHVRLLHSRFTSIDRTYKEAEVLEILNSGNRKYASERMFIVGTQVMEQFLDLDFDILITDLCPMDLLIQRIGRLHRHNRERSDKVVQAICCVIDTGSGDFEKGSEKIYGKYHLMNSRELLRCKGSIKLPDEIPDFVHTAYGEGGVDISEELLDEYRRASQELKTNMKKKEVRAKAFQIGYPERIADLRGWTHAGTEDTERAAQATVRDTHGSLEVILVQRGTDGKFCFIPSVEGYSVKEIPSNAVPDRDIAFTLAGCKVALPSSLSANWNLDGTIRALEADNLKEIPKHWMESEWLNGELFLILDKYNIGTIKSKVLRYDSELGLVELDG